MQHPEYLCQEPQHCAIKGNRLFKEMADTQTRPQKLTRSPWELPTPVPKEEIYWIAQKPLPTDLMSPLTCFPWVLCKKVTTSIVMVGINSQMFLTRARYNILSRAQGSRNIS